MEGFGCNITGCRYCHGESETVPAPSIDRDSAARMIAVLCASILAAAAGEKDHMKVLATSDIYMDFIRPQTLHVARDGNVSFEGDEPVS